MSEWILVSERLPEFKTEVLAFWDGRRVIAQLHQGADRKLWSVQNLGGYFEHKRFTHWMPLPDKPERA